MRKQEYFKHSSTMKTRIGHNLRHESLLHYIIEGRTMGGENSYKC